MELEPIRPHLQQKYRFEERAHAFAILANDFPDEFADILDCLDTFCLRRSYIAIAGGSRSLIPIMITGFLRNRGWREKFWPSALVSPVVHLCRVPSKESWAAH